MHAVAVRAVGKRGYHDIVLRCSLKSSLHVSMFSFEIGEGVRALCLIP